MLIRFLSFGISFLLDSSITLLGIFMSPRFKFSLISGLILGDAIPLVEVILPVSTKLGISRLNAGSMLRYKFTNSFNCGLFPSNSPSDS